MPVQQFEPVQNWFSDSPLPLNQNLNLKFGSVQFRLCKPNHGSILVQFQFEPFSKLNFGSTMPTAPSCPYFRWSGRQVLLHDITGGRVTLADAYKGSLS